MRIKVKNIAGAAMCFGMLSLVSCKDDPPVSSLPEPTPHQLELPRGWPTPRNSADNPLTEEGISLGKALFFDPILSGGDNQSCGSCHNQAFAFTDNGKRFSVGSKGDIGTRNSMPLFNLNWSSRYFWDGRQPGLEELVAEPIEAHFEMNLKMEDAVKKLSAHPQYPALFKLAFPKQGIQTTTIRYAIAQYMRTLISSDSKWDEYFRANPRFPETLMSPAERRGYIVFITEEKGDCFHCHSPLSPLFVNTNEREFSNNGLDASPQSGLMAVTGKPGDLGKFKTPSLRNVMVTAPYMHDGRFATIDEVLDHYDTGFKFSTTLDAMLIKHVDQNTLKPIKRLTAQDKEDLKAFLHLLTDKKFIGQE